MKLGSPTILEVKPNGERTEFRFRLTFPEQPEPIEFSVSSESAMMMMHGLQTLQARYKIPIPDSIRPHGRPVLRIVMDDE